VYLDKIGEIKKCDSDLKSNHRICKSLAESVGLHSVPQILLFCTKIGTITAMGSTLVPLIFSSSK